MPSLGLMIGLPIAVILILVCWIAGLLISAAGKRSPRDGEVVWFGRGVVGAGFVIVIIALIAMFPYSWEYHSWQKTSGRVANVNSRIIPSGDKTVEQRFAVTFTDGRMRACDDTRCTQVKPGGTLTLKCKRHWQWAATPGYDCNFVDYR